MYDFFEISNEMLCVANRAGYLVRVNSAWTRSLGWSQAELTSRPFLDFIHPDDVASTVREAAKLHRGDGYEAVGFENRYRCRDGGYRWLSWHTRLVPETSELVATARDVTEQKLAADALRFSEQRFRTLADHAPVSIFLADLHGRNTFVNRRWCEISGLTPEETAGFGWRAAIHPDDLQAKMTRFDSRMADGREYDNEYRIVHRDGDVRWVRTFAAPILNQEGTATTIVGMTMDVTDQHQLLEELRRERELLCELLEVQERERQAVCNDMHDGLMQHVTAAIMELEATEAGPLPVTAQFNLQRAIRELRRGLEDGRRVIRGIRPAALDDLGLQAAISDLCEEVRSGGVDVECFLDPSIDTLGPPLQTTIYRIVQESLANVRKHSRAQRATLRIVPRDGTVVVAVEDTGRGFANVHLDPAQAPDVERGLGLLGMRERVRLAGGTCVVDSEPGGGTRIRATLPIETHVTDAVADC